jgi:hypothetical protein
MSGASTRATKRRSVRVMSIRRRRRRRRVVVVVVRVVVFLMRHFEIDCG